MVELFINVREYEKVINFYKEGLIYDDIYILVRVYFLEVEKRCFVLW